MTGYGKFSRRTAAALAALGLAATLTFTSAGMAAAAVTPAVPPTPKSGPVAGGTTVNGAVPGVAPFVQVTGGMATTWALTAGGVIWAWGQNYSDGFANAYGTGAADGASWPPAVLTQDAAGNPLPPFKLIGESGFSAIDTAGNIWIWGVCPKIVYDPVTDDPSCPGALAYPTKLTKGINRSGATVALPKFTQISSASGGYIALDANGNVWTWGDNSDGQLGIGSGASTDPTVPIERPAIGPGIKSISYDASGTTVLALDKNGNIWWWGADTAQNFYPPTKLTGAGLPTFKYVAGGYQAPSAIDTSGNIWLLFGGPEMVTSGFDPVKMTATDSGAPVSFKSVTGNQDVVVGIDSKGGLWVVGNNNGGSLGLGIPEPDLSGTTPGCDYSAGGGSHACAMLDLTKITKDMSGNPIPTFTAIGTQTRSQASTAIAADGSIWYWGWDNNGYAWWDETVTSGMLSQWIAPAPLLSLQPVVTGVTFGGVAGTNLTLTTKPVSGKYANYQTAADTGAYTVVDPSGACGPVDVVVSYDLRLTWAIPSQIDTIVYVEDGYQNSSQNVVGVSYQTADTSQTPLTYKKGFTYTGATCPSVDTGGAPVDVTPWMALVGVGMMVTAGLVLGVRRRVA